MSYFLTAGLLVLPLIRLLKNIQNTTKYFCTIPWLLANSFETFIFKLYKNELCESYVSNVSMW